MEYNLIVDVDGTICEVTSDYENAIPKLDVIKKINLMYDHGSYIMLYTARGMRTFNNNVEQIEKYHRPILEEWLSRYHVKYDELRFGKPWLNNVLYIDDKGLTPTEFLRI